MKSYLKIIGGAILVGVFCAFWFFKDVQKDVEAITDAKKAYIFQVGVFKSQENAHNFLKQFTSGIVYQDTDYYRVFIGLTTDLKNKEKLRTLYDAQEINFFIKEYIMDPEFFEKIANYELLLGESDNYEVISKINQEMLNIFQEMNP